MSFGPCEDGNDCREYQCRSNQNPKTGDVFFAHVHENGGEVVEQIDWDNEKEDDDRGGDGSDDVFDPGMAVINFDTLGLFSTLLT